jgi:hypothetical protein
VAYVARDYEDLARPYACPLAAIELDEPRARGNLDERARQASELHDVRVRARPGGGTVEAKADGVRQRGVAVHGAYSDQYNRALYSDARASTMVI